MPGFKGGLIEVFPSRNTVRKRIKKGLALIRVAAKLKEEHERNEARDKRQAEIDEKLRKLYPKLSIEQEEYITREGHKAYNRAYSKAVSEGCPREERKLHAQRAQQERRTSLELYLLRKAQWLG